MAEIDDLDDLIGDSLAGVDSALKDQKTSTDTAPATSAADVVKELQEGPKEDGSMGNLIKLFQGDALQKAMADALESTGGEAPASVDAKKDDGESGDFLQNFLKSFESTVGSDDQFATQLSGLMTSMLSNDLICEPMKQIAELLEPWLKEQKDLPECDRKRYQQQLDKYKNIIGIYSQNPDPLPEGVREEVQRLLSELHALGQPPDEVMNKITPKDAAPGDDESFEGFMKTMGLADGLSSEEQEMLKKLSEDPEELTKAMQEMAGQLGQGGGEDCKQQ